MIESLHLSFCNWALIALCAFLVGMSKTGVQGVSMVVIPILALIFGGKNSTGILLPILIMADVFGVSYYNQHANWKHVLRALPWAIAGVLLALYVGDVVDDRQFTNIIAMVVFFSLGLMLWRDVFHKGNYTPSNRYFPIVMGFFGGFATMIGNAAGPVFAIYLLALRLPKNEFIGTAAWFFFIINIIKLPLHVWVWKTINWSSLAVDVITLPTIILGAVTGIWLVKKINSNWYRWFVIVATICSAIVMVL